MARRLGAFDWAVLDAVDRGSADAARAVHLAEVSAALSAPVASVRRSLRLLEQVGVVERHRVTDGHRWAWAPAEADEAQVATVLRALTVVEVPRPPFGGRRAGAAPTPTGAPVRSAAPLPVRARRRPATASIPAPAERQVRTAG